MVANLKINDVILMGDFNGACDYVKSFADVALATDPRFYWLVTDKMDTTTGNTDCAYDRFVVAGENMLKGVVLGSTGVFHFDQTYHLNTEQVLFFLLFLLYILFSLWSKRLKHVTFRHLTYY